MLSWIKRLLFDPLQYWLLITLIVIGETVLSALIVRFVPYTEIDWIAYCQEVAGYLGGDTNYANLRGDTGPLVYPAGFVYVYSVLYWLTDSGANILRAQYIFVALYVCTIAVVAKLYAAASGKHVPNWVVLLICASRRIHSIFMLRLFNDGIAMLVFYVSVLLLTRGKYLLANIGLSLAVSVKMNILLFAPSWLIILWHGLGFWASVPYLLLCAAIQVALGLPFLMTHPVEYLRGSFDFGRVFFFKWTVNWKFLDEEFFVSKQWALTLLSIHMILLFIYLHYFACASENGLFSFLRKLLFGNHNSQRQIPSAQFIVTTLFFGNFIGVMCARSLHYQFYSWYFFSLPFLLWQTNLPVILRILVLAAVEVCWNVYPAQPWSSALLLCCHALLFVSFVTSKHAAPAPFGVENPTKEINANSKSE